MERWRQKELAKFYESKKLLEEYAKEHPEVYTKMFVNIPEAKDFDKMMSELNSINFQKKVSKKSE